MNTFYGVNADNDDTVQCIYGSDMPGDFQLALQCPNRSQDNFALVKFRL